ncbi:MAG: hypothetical protein AB8G23_02520 [Myxococcota bacterium]
MKTLTKPDAPAAPHGRRGLLLDVLIVAALCGAVALIYGQTLGHALVDFDDFIYLRDNGWLRDPLDRSWIFRALREPYAAYWIPLTWLSYRVEYLFSEGAPAATFAVNAALHAANSALLYWAIRRMTGARGKAAFVAAIFAVHPLHVESVAWASERKDVLSTFFWMTALHFYASARKTRDRNRRDACDIGVAICLGLGLLAKPMLVTFPFALLLLDFWPLGRFRKPGENWGSINRSAVRRAVLEKVPLLAIAMGAALVVLNTQKTMGGRSFTADMGLAARAANATESYAAYLGQTFVPTNLSPFYPLNPTRDIGRVWLPVLFGIAAITLAGWRARETRPWLLVGWLWFLGNLVPVIGFVGVGMQSRADRWMYIPLIGLAIICAWGAEEIFTHGHSAAASAAQPPRPWKRHLLPGFGLLSLIALSLISHRQVGYWSNTESLFGHAREASGPNWYAEHRLAVRHRLRGELEEAERHYVASLAAEPRNARIQGELADVARALGKHSLADELYANVKRTGWHDTAAHARLAAILDESGWTGPARSLRERTSLPAVGAGPSAKGKNTSLGRKHLR